MAGCFHDGCVNPKSDAPDQLLSYCIKISANAQHWLVLLTYTFIVPKSDYRSNRLDMLCILLLKRQISYCCLIYQKGNVLRSRNTSSLDTVVTLKKGLL